MDYRSNSDYEQRGQFTSWANEKPSTADSASSQSKIIANTSNTSELHRVPTVLTVSPSGERKTSALENPETYSLNDTNPFLDSVAVVADIAKLDENLIPKLSSKNLTKFRQQNRRKTQAKNRRKADKIILTQQLLESAHRRPKCAAVQTDSALGLANCPESIGDGRRCSQSCLDLSSSSTIETIYTENLTSKQFLSENQRKFLSFLVMVVLIFWLTSIILDVEIPAEFCRIILNYFWSFKSAFYLQEKQLTFSEKCWQVIKSLLEYLF